MSINSSIKKHIKERALLLDGAMGTMLKKYKLDVNLLKRKEFLPVKDIKLLPCDFFNINQSDIVAKIHSLYLDAGADIILTNTFSSNSISLSKFGLQSMVYELNYKAAITAKKIADEYSYKNKNKPRWVAGDIGPSTIRLSTCKCSADNKTLIHESYREQINAFVDAGVDLLLIETIVDTSNAIEILKLIDDVFVQKNISIPLMMSFVVDTESGLSYNKQSIVDFLTSINTDNILSVGFNCIDSSRQILDSIISLNNIECVYTSFCPNAGLPNADGIYESVESDIISNIEYLNKYSNIEIFGGCCGTTPKFIKLLKECLYISND